jgi:dihydrofolate reductase
LIKAIFATDIQGGIGRNGSLPWPHDKEDLKYFKELTTNHIVVMGSNTWQDPKMPKPLPNRMNVVVTNQDINLFKDHAEVVVGSELAPSLEVLQHQNPKKIVWIIGGAKLLRSCHPYISEIYLTTFMTDFNCDVQIDMNRFLDEFIKVSEHYGRNKIFTKWTRTSNHEKL